MTLIRLERVSKSYDQINDVLRNIDLSISEGEFVVLVGASGCGKTTLLRMINRLIEPTSGEILVKGKNIRDWNKIELRRSIGYVIQETGLFPHMTIQENISYVLTIQKKDREYKQKRSKELINLVGIPESYLNKYPRELSGGQKQRIGVARALASDPEIILMDEPFGAIDEITRKNLQDELKSIHDHLKKTIIFVTHDIQEALKLGTRIILLKDGQIEQEGDQDNLIFKPGTDYVKDFFGIKGFKATLDEKVVTRAYNRILDGEITMDDLFK